MGGIETSRGILYQAVAAVLEAFEDDRWDEISVEFKTEDDKVDIALLFEDVLLKAIQVKSSINAFGKSDVQSWLDAMYNDLKKTDKPTKEYQVCLIGPCTSGVMDIANAIDKYYMGNLDKKASEALSTFNRTIFDSSKVTIKQLPFELSALMGIAHSRVHKYSDDKNLQLNYTQIDLIKNAIINIKTIISTQGEPISRQVFEERIIEWLKQMKSKTIRETKKISIRSFARGTEKTHDDADFAICFLDMFEHRKLRNELCWNEDVCKRLADQLGIINDSSFEYQLFINSNLSITFAIGRFFDSKKGIDIYPVQRIAGGGEQSWKITEDSNIYPSWDARHLKDYKTGNDTLNNVLIINATHDITEQVEKYLEENQIETGRRIICELPSKSNTAIINGNHAKQLADEIPIILAKRETSERRAMLHIFIAAPASFVFYLGNVSRGFGKCTLYEYDFEQTDTGTYSASMTFPNKIDL